MSRIFKTRTFNRWAKKSGIGDDALRDAVTEMERGLIDAELGGYLFKKRVALPGRGKSGSTRTIVATRFEERLFFLFGFEKNERDNISPGELASLKQAADALLNLETQTLRDMLATGGLIEVEHAEKPDH